MKRSTQPGLSKISKPPLSLEVCAKYCKAENNPIAEAQQGWRQGTRKFGCDYGQKMSDILCSVKSCMCSWPLALMAHRVTELLSLSDTVTIILLDPTQPETHLLTTGTAPFAGASLLSPILQTRNIRQQQRAIHYLSRSESRWGQSWASHIDIWASKTTAHPMPISPMKQSQAW